MSADTSPLLEAVEARRAELDEAVAVRRAATGGVAFAKARVHERRARERFALQEAFAGTFEARLHPRDRMGRWRDVIGSLSPGSRIDLPGGVSVRRGFDPEEKFNYTVEIHDPKILASERKGNQRWAHEMIARNPGEAASDVVQALKDNETYPEHLDLPEGQMKMDLSGRHRSPDSGRARAMAHAAANRSRRERGLSPISAQDWMRQYAT